ncbi:MAG: serine/threonine protein kinase [Myxococcales bacterium]|nr:serine/threonine protein kinase [Myxococcales bacterium]
MIDELVGRTLRGRYRVLYPIAKGGMGAVFEAEDLEARRRVALKVVRQEFLRDVVSIERFRREATISAAVKHRSLVATLDLALDGDPLFFVMELVDGPAVSELLAHTERLPWPRAAKIAADVAEGLSALHDAGIVHRDVKPSNVMLVREPDGERAKIIDFGVVRSANQGDQSSLTWTGNVVGTPAFMAPEQLSGDAVDGRSDLYSLGVLLAKMLLGTHAALRLPLDSAAALEGWPDDVPSSLRALVHSLLRGSRADRPSSAHEVARALGAIVATAPAPSPSPELREADSSYGSYLAAPSNPSAAPVAAAAPVATHNAPVESTPLFSKLPASDGGSTREDPSLDRAAPAPPSPERSARTPRALIALGSIATIAAVVAVSAVTSVLATRTDRNPAAFARADLPAPDARSPYPLRVDQTPQGARYVPLGTHLEYRVAGANDARARELVLPRITAALEACLDLRAHTLGDQLVSVLLTIDPRGRVLSNDRDERMVGDERESRCADGVLRAASWPTHHETYTLRFVAMSM